RVGGICAAPLGAPAVRAQAVATSAWALPRALGPVPFPPPPRAPGGTEPLTATPDRDGPKTPTSSPTRPETNAPLAFTFRGPTPARARSGLLMREMVRS